MGKIAKPKYRGKLMFSDTHIEIPCKWCGECIGKSEFIVDDSLDQDEEELKVLNHILIEHSNLIKYGYMPQECDKCRKAKLMQESELRLQHWSKELNLDATKPQHFALAWRTCMDWILSMDDPDYISDFREQ